MGTGLKRRRVLGSAAGVVLGRAGAAGAALSGAALSGAALLSGCERRRDVRQAAALPAEQAAQLPQDLPVAWLGVSAERGHRLRIGRSGALPAPARQRRCDVLVIGGGIAGLAAARALRRAGIDDLAVLELEDQAGGNSRGATLGGLRCPLGAHYLPVPDPAVAPEVAEWLHELGLLRTELGRTRADERHLCHSPQERLFIDGGWVEGLLPPAEAGSPTLAAYRSFGAAVAQVQRALGFAMPSLRAPWTAGHDALDRETFAQWLAREGFGDARLRWYLDYVCRDDYGAGIDTVSAWAGLHYFASRHGFHAGGDEPADHEPMFTWPEGNGWLAERLAAPLAERVQPGRVVLQLDEDGRDTVQALAWSAADDAIEAWQARAVVMALPLFIAARLFAAPRSALTEAARGQPHAPWLVTNLQLREPLLDRGIGAAPAWDNVIFGSPSPVSSGLLGALGSLGYVDASHQRLDPRPAPTVLTHYAALPQTERGALLAAPARAMAQRVVDELSAVHPDLTDKLVRVGLVRYGHAMAIPVPGQRGSTALAALAREAGRVQFAHADLSAYSVLEEAFTHGDRAGRGVAAWLRRK